ncbi:MAG: FAD:protein FMN transferase [Coriobacteriaceae bacterium]|nr:FAD:protein FMN transferase [Coriobacteriaceae bacterium]
MATPIRTPQLTRRSLVRATALGGCLAALGGCAAGTRPSSAGSHSQSKRDTQGQPSTGSVFAFDTYCTFTVYGDATAPAKLAQACTCFDRLFNMYDSSSDIARINAAQGEPVAADPATIDLLEQALAFCQAAQGLFDITIGAVSTLWDFTEGIRPSDADLADALPHVNWRFVELDASQGTVRLSDPEAKIDLGGIAKGYVADQLCELLERETQASGAVLSLGGNIAFFGSKPGGAPWEAGIRDPNDPHGSTVVGTARVAGGSLVTSGLYERTFELDGKKYWHILDPRTGMPVQTDVASDTVFCPSSTTADALSTTLFVAGSREGAAIANAHEGTAAYFILQNGGTAESARWQNLTDFRA